MRSLLKNVKVALIGAALTFVCMSFIVKANDTRQHQPTVTMISGSIDTRTQKNFEEILLKQENNIIGIDVNIDIINKEKQITIHTDRNQTEISFNFDCNGSPCGSYFTFEKGSRYLNGSYLIKGYYIPRLLTVKRGYSNWGFDPVEEASIRLNPFVKFKHIELK